MREPSGTFWDAVGSGMQDSAEHHPGNGQNRAREQNRPAMGCPLQQRGAGVSLLDSDQATH